MTTLLAALQPLAQAACATWLILLIAGDPAARRPFTRR